MPLRLLDLWRTFSGFPADPQACLINFYSESAKMGMHQDRDEADFSAPVLSVSLVMPPVPCRRRPPRERTVSFRLESGDIVLIGGQSRLPSTALTDLSCDVNVAEKWRADSI